MTSLVGNFPIQDFNFLISIRHIQNQVEQLHDLVLELLDRVKKLLNQIDKFRF
ncbi:hypothetical protein NC981_22095 [Leptolyngbya sp. DQ-M1]|uniref:hypothetical protein n=1 Tax=Leptolyngbya sp. DQ-M1 TaxID=2933920 RepID=UPI003299FAE6